MLHSNWNRYKRWVRRGARGEEGGTGSVKSVSAREPSRPTMLPFHRGCEGCYPSDVGGGGGKEGCCLSFFGGECYLLRMFGGGGGILSLWCWGIGGDRVCTTHVEVRWNLGLGVSQVGLGVTRDKGGLDESAQQRGRGGTREGCFNAVQGEEK